MSSPISPPALPESTLKVIQESLGYYNVETAGLIVTQVTSSSGHRLVGVYPAKSSIVTADLVSQLLPLLAPVSGPLTTFDYHDYTVIVNKIDRYFVTYITQQNNPQ